MESARKSEKRKNGDIYCQVCFAVRDRRQLIYCVRCATVQCFAHGSYAGAEKGSVEKMRLSDRERTYDVRRGTCDACVEFAKREAETARLVVHCKRSPHDVYVGRGSKWGNPYAIGEFGTRDEVIALYEQYLLASPDLIASLPELRGRVLGCWCAPKPCHGHVLARYANQL